MSVFPALEKLFGLWLSHA